jgi:RNA polymerase sigma-70 factor, ECF subfamily
MVKESPAEIILKDYQHKIYWLALSITRNEKDAEDVLQNALIKILRKLPGFKQRSKLSTWIYRIAYNESLMYLRKKRRLYNSANALRDYTQRLPAGGFSVNWSRLPDEELVNKELRERIDTALNNLPIQYRMPLLLHRLEGFSLAQSSQVLGLKPSTVKTRLHRAYLMVKDSLNRYFKDLPATELPQEQACGIWTHFLFDYAHQNLTPGRQDSFTSHIQDCPRCNRFLDSYQQAIRITGALDCRDLPLELKAKIKSFLK